MSETPKDPQDPQDTPQEPTKPGPKKGFSGGNYEIIELTAEQKTIADANWDKLDHQTLTRLIFGNDTLDGRSTEGRSVKAYVTGEGKSLKTTKKTPKGKYELTEEQRTFIETNCKETKVSEMVKLLFPGQRLSIGSAECRAVYNYVREIDSESVNLWEEAVESSQYKAPVQLSSLIGRINSYVSNTGDYLRATYDQGKLRPSDNKNLHALMGHLRSKPFFYQASGYTRYVDRDLFEANFIRWVHDKASDLSLSEVALFISAAAKSVSIAKLERTIEALEDRAREALLEQDDQEGSKTKLSMSLVELISTSRKELGTYTNQLKTMIEGLEGERAKRLKDRNDRNASFTHLVDAWMIQESRLGIIALGIKEKEEDEEEVGKIKSMTDVLGLIAGQSEEEASN